MNTISVREFDSPVGTLIIGAYKDSLCLCDWKYRSRRDQIDYRMTRYLQADYRYEEHPILDRTIEELEKYFQGNLSEFSIPVMLCGTDFQKSVWEDLMTIHYGTALSYDQLSRKRNKPKSIRAIAAANGANAISIIVPCHRVIGKNGDLTGYAGGLMAKERLLTIENVDLSHGQQRLF